MNYAIDGVHMQTISTWDYKAPEGAGDNYEAHMRGTKANLMIKQDSEENFKPVLYIEPVANDEEYANILYEKIKIVQEKYPGVALQKTTSGWMIMIPEKFEEGHEAHFASVTKNFLQYLQNKSMPAWEVPNMLAKYYITTKALQIAGKTK